MMMEGILSEPEVAVSQQRRIVAVSAREIVGGLFIEVAKTDDLHSWLSSLRLRLVVNQFASLRLQIVGIE